VVYVPPASLRGVGLCGYSGCVLNDGVCCAAPFDSPILLRSAAVPHLLLLPAVILVVLPLHHCVALVYAGALHVLFFTPACGFHHAAAVYLHVVTTYRRGFATATTVRAAARYELPVPPFCLHRVRFVGFTDVRADLPIPGRFLDTCHYGWDVSCLPLFLILFYGSGPYAHCCTSGGHSRSSWTLLHSLIPPLHLPFLCT